MTKHSAGAIECHGNDRGSHTVVVRICSCGFENKVVGDVDGIDNGLFRSLFLIQYIVFYAVDSHVTCYFAGLVAAHAVCDYIQTDFIVAVKCILVVRPFHTHMRFSERSKFHTAVPDIFRALMMSDGLSILPYRI